MAITTNVPSDQFEDLQRDVQDATRFVNQPSGTFTNRTGKQITPIPVISDNANNALSSLTVIVAGDFDTGTTVTARNQVVLWPTSAGGDGREYRWAGELDKVVPPGSTPLTTGGISDSAWVYTADVAFEQALAAVDSGKLIGGVTAEQLVSDANSNTAYSAANTKSIGRSVGVTLIDMHYGAMRGRGLSDTETLSDGKGGYTLSGTAAAGQPVITLTSNESAVFDIPLVVGQLVCYLATDGQYYSASIKSITGTAPATVTLNSNIEVSIAAGVNLFSFMSNEAHPIFYGYRAIADYALRKAKTVTEKVVDTVWGLVNSATRLIDITDSYDNCGSSSVAAYNVTMPTALTDGISTSFTAAQTGPYIARIVINTNGHPVNIAWSYSGLGNTVVVNCSDVQSFDIPLTVRSSAAGGLVTITAFSQDAASIINVLDKVQIFKVIGATPNLDTCKHVLLGDSWFDQEGIFERLQDRLPLATIVNKGVGGNTAAQLLARFDTDVTPENPDIVWIIAGTNDYYQSVTNDLFNFYINQLASKCANIGAHLMVFNVSVGGAPFDSGRFNRSRQLANLTNYVRASTAVTTKRKIVFNIPRMTIPNGSSQWQIINFGLYVNSFKITSYYVSAGTLTVGNKTSLDNTQNSPVALTANSYVTADVDLAFSGGRFVDLRAANSSGSDIALYGYVEVEEP